jgi:hypothetical protein
MIENSTDPNRAAIIDEQLADVRQLETDARERGWTGEAARNIASAKPSTATPRRPGEDLHLDPPPRAG